MCSYHTGLALTSTAGVGGRLGPGVPAFARARAHARMWQAVLLYRLLIQK